MKEENTRKLCEAFPLLYRGRRLPTSENLMSFGFSCDNGWFQLLWDLSEKLEKMIEAFPCTEDDIRPLAVQVKEKFGTLRFYTIGFGEEGYALIEEAEEKSATICERCGEPGEVRPLPWVRTLCDKHFGAIIDDMIDAIVNRIDDLLLEDNFKKVDEILRNVAVERRFVEELMAYLTITGPARDKLSDREAFFLRVEAELVKRGVDPELLLKGLK